MRRPGRKEGFTLIELSIVLVIIGLIVGGILVGQDLIKAAEVRAQISQIEKYNQAVNTFYSKYQALPGDMPASVANQFGFAARGLYPGEGDGNGVIEGVNGNGAIYCWGFLEGTGETVMFWVDLSQANLIDQTFTTATSNTIPASIITNATSEYLPTAKLGGGNYIYVWSGGLSAGTHGEGNNINYFGLSAVTQIPELVVAPFSTPNVSAQQAYSVDKKIDDGLPTTGSVTAMYVNQVNGAPGNVSIQWAAGGGNQGTSGTAATPETTTTCFDNSSVAGAGQQYSMGSLADYGAHANCALSFRFQ